MPGETKKEILEIDLTHLSPDDTFRVSQFFKEGLKQGIRIWETNKGPQEEKREPYSFGDGTQFKFKQAVIAYLNQPDEVHFLINPDSSKRLPEGGFAWVFYVDSFSFDQQGVFCLKTNQYVAKVQRIHVKEIHPKGFVHNNYCNFPYQGIPIIGLESLQRELFYARKTQHLHIKEPTFLRISPNIYLSFTLMAKLPGRELMDIVADDHTKKYRLTPNQRLELFKKLLKTSYEQTEALEIVHRDIKLENIIAQIEPMVVNLCDYGGALSPLDPNPSIGGTIKYQAPELPRMGKPEPSQVTSKLDVFSLGLVLARLFWIALELEENHPAKVKNDAKTKAFIEGELKNWSILEPPIKNIILEILVGMVKIDPNERLGFVALNTLAAKIPSVPSEPFVQPPVEDKIIAPSPASKIDYFFKGPSAEAHETIKLTFEALEKKIDKLSIDKYIKFFESHEQSGDLKKAALSYLLSYIELLEKIEHLKQVKNPSEIPLLLENFVKGTSPDFLKTMSETINPRIKNHPLILAAEELKNSLEGSIEDLILEENPVRMRFAG